MTKPNYEKEAITKDYILNNTEIRDDVLYWKDDAARRRGYYHRGKPVEFTTNPSTGYKRLRTYIDGKCIDLNAGRVVWLAATGEWPTLLIDHIDRDPTNNKFSNLRQVTEYQNAVNRETFSSTGYKGVRETPSGYSVAVVRKGVTSYFGTYKCPIEAALVYDENAKIIHGEYAVLNFPELRKDKPND